jgi:hypothetical protein
MSERRRAARRPTAGYRTSLPWLVVTGYAQYVGWDRLPVLPGLLTLLGLRVRLRQENLHDTGRLPSAELPEPAPPSESHKVDRTADGSHNDLGEPRMGMAGTRFGRNIPLDRIAPATPEDVLSRPSPREVSRALLTGDGLTPAESVNSLVATWLQFMVRDWFSHGTSPSERPWEIPLTDDDPWPERPMRIMRTPDDPTRDPAAAAGTPDTRVNVSSHWWDASQLYGSNETEQRLVPTGELGKVHLWDDEQSPFPSVPSRDPSRVPGFWLGLAMMQHLFARGRLQDLAATDILRSRELGVPRYNEFRRLLRLRPAKTFAELTDNPRWAEEIERLYDGDVEKVDLMVGLYAERPPAGFAFSDTAFRIFVLMASRRLNSDRFFTEYYTPEVYSTAGMAWIDDNSMITVLLRHHPELRTALAGLTNAFVPWHTAGRTVN